MTKVNATIMVCAQVGIDVWKNYYHTKTFSTSATMAEIIVWAQQYIRENFHINDIIFSQVDEETK